jgi:hypothetical protein
MLGMATINAVVLFFYKTAYCACVRFLGMAAGAEPA